MTGNVSQKEAKEESKEEVKKEVGLNKDGLEPGKPVTFEQIAKANLERSKQAKKDAEAKVKQKTKAK